MGLGIYNMESASSPEILPSPFALQMRLGTAAQFDFATRRSG